LVISAIEADLLEISKADSFIQIISLISRILINLFVENSLYS